MIGKEAEMRKRQILVGVLLLATVGLLAGCGGPAAPTEPVAEEAVPVVFQEDGDKVIAEAVIEPARWSELSFEGGGTVVEVLVKEGDVVSAGDLLVRLDPTDAELAVQEAEAALAAARAQLARVKAGPRPEELVVAEARLEAARAAISQAAAQRDRLAGGETEADIAAVQAELARAMAEQRQAENLHERTLRCFEFELPDGSESVICPALGRPEELSRFAMQAADAGLTAAQLQLEATQGGAEARLRDAGAGVWSAAAQRDIAQARLELMKAGSTPEEIASAEAEVTQAEAALAAAKAALERAEMRAPFAGTVTQVNVKVGETAIQGEVIVVLATLERLQARSSDLTELDVARVAEGQAVVVTVDALPEVQMRGHVARIEEESVDYRGDVTYPVIVALDESVPELRWGMTALVEIEAD
jgi:multidrug efflux pump subunit AcrA (membrane-fusion protein)